MYEKEVQGLQARLRQYVKTQICRDNELAELKEAVRKMTVREGKCRERIPTWEAGGAGGGKQPPPPPRMYGAAGADPDDDDNDEHDEDPHRGGSRRPAGPLKHKKAPPLDDDDDEDGTGDGQLDLFVKALAKAMGKTTRVPVEPPPVFKNEGH